MSAHDELLSYIFDGRKPAFYHEFEGWVRESRRFRVFAMTYRTKIRAKYKNAHTESSLKDVRAELLTAALLLREERFTLAYETYAAAKQRGPDFTVTFKTHTPFNVEVRRIGGIELAESDPDAHITKLTAVLCDKVGQMPAGIVNLLWLFTDRNIEETDLTRANNTLRELAERKTEAFFIGRGFTSAAHFLKHYQHLSGIVLRPSGQPVLWLNALARHKTPSEIVTAIQRLETR